MAAAPVVSGGDSAAARAKAKAMVAAAARAASTPAWMSEMMGLEEETGLTCMVCHEGYRCKVRTAVSWVHEWRVDGVPGVRLLGGGGGRGRRKDSLLLCCFEHVRCLSS